jgi:large-conductance mechanosensitive channel
MDQTARTFTAEGVDTRKWVGRIITAVILGEAIWNVIVSVMNNVVVPWLGDLFGQSSGLPTSFTQRPYNYPELFVSIIEFCIAGLVAAILNYFFQRPRTRKISRAQGPVLVTPVEPVRVSPQDATTAAMYQTSTNQTRTNPARTNEASTNQAGTSQVTTNQTAMNQIAMSQAAISQPTLPASPPPPPPKLDPVSPIAPVTAVQVSKPVDIPPPAPPVVNPVVKPVAALPKAAPSKPKKPKEVYYNIVGEPMPSDDD